MGNCISMQFYLSQTSVFLPWKFFNNNYLQLTPKVCINKKQWAIFTQLTKDTHTYN